MNIISSFLFNTVDEKYGKIIDEGLAGRLQNAKNIESVVGIADDVKNSKFLAEILFMKAVHELNKGNVEKAYNKIYKGIESFDTNTVPDECKEAVAKLLLISGSNESLQNSYNTKMIAWTNQMNSLKNNEPSLNENDYEAFWTPFHGVDDRDAYFKSFCTSGFHNYKWNGEYQVQNLFQAKGKCTADTAKMHKDWETKVNNLLIQKPKDPIYLPLPSVNCLNCSQNLNITDGSVVNTDKLTQQINCAINEKKLTPITPKNSTSDVPSPTIQPQKNDDDGIFNILQNYKNTLPPMVFYSIVVGISLFIFVCCFILIIYVT